MSTIGLLPGRCRGCVAWELDAAAARSAARAGEAEFEKEVWLSGVMLTWGSAGQVVTVDDQPVGFALYAPPTAVPGAAAFPTSPVSPDAVLLTTARIDPSFTGQGLARFLLEGVIRELTRRGVRAIELFGREDDPGPAAAADDPAPAYRQAPSAVAGDDPTTAASADPANGADSATGPAATGAERAGTEPARPAGHGADHLAGEDGIPSCVLPAGFARAVGFTEVKPHHRYPRLRLELGRDIGWKAEVEAALEELFASVTIPASPPPAARELVGAGTNLDRMVVPGCVGPGRVRPNRGCAARGPAGPRR